MKVTVLMENTAVNSQFYAEHGLSLYLETEGHRILFDMGQTEAFADNAEKLGIDLQKVDFAVLSHGHYDHGGGLKRFLEINHTAPVYLSRFAFEPHFSGREKNIGLDPALQENERLHEIGDTYTLAEGIKLYSCNGFARPFETNSYGLYTIRDRKLIEEDFRHEQYMVLHEEGRRIVISGCSHKGILNITEWLRPDVLIGGFHFKKLDPAGAGRQVLEDAARRLKEYPTVFYTGHCTGTEQLSFLKKRMGEQLHGFSAGQVFTV